ncbi:hypothetical protein BJV82DRAFT_667231 [Fennellomyces sp. T-0311]|nr:hypothetical protein BJV82DRAFT_667231 [Fennellomyces sp. T-0311]
MTLTPKDKREFERVFDLLDKRKFWILEASKREAIKKGVEAKSVEEKLKKLALDSCFLHPCRSFIIDVDDKNWNDHLSAEELQEIEGTDTPLLVSLEATVAAQPNNLRKLSSPEEAYNFCVKSNMIQKSNRLWPGNKTPISSYLEAGMQYWVWGFVTSIYHSEDNITAMGTPSVFAHILVETAQDSCQIDPLFAHPRFLHNVFEKSACAKDGVQLYVGGGVELGAMEIDSRQDDTKEFKDAKIKLPHFMKDMLLAIVNKSPSLLHKAQITGLSINGEDITMMSADSPSRYITRIRRTLPISFPASSDSFIVRIAPLFELATIAMLKMEDTLNLFNSTEIPLQGSQGRHVIFPPTFHLPQRHQPPHHQNQWPSAEK